MTWLTWRQIRTPALLVLAGLAAIAVALLLTAPGVADAYDAGGLADCVAGNDNPNAQETCGDIEGRFLSQYRWLRPLGDWMTFVPALIGAFWGAPLLAREYEAGTHRLVWTQSVTRSRWLAVKLAVVGGLALVAVAGLSLLFTWWVEPFDRVGDSRLHPATFAERGLAPAAYAAFAFVLGVAIGAVVRRTVPAMAALLAAFLALRMGVQTWVRPRLLAPHETTFPTFTFYGADPPGWTESTSGWVLSTRTVDGTGYQYPGDGQELDTAVMDRCGQGELRATKELLDACGQQLGLRNVVSFHPADSFWPLQVWETAIFAGLTVVVAVFTFWWIRRRLA